MLLVLVTAHEPVQDVILVGGDHQLADGQAHLFGQVTGKDVAEVTGGHGERHTPVRSAQRQGRLEVVHDLGHDPGPVDGVHRRQLGLATQEALVAKAFLDHALAVVEVALHGDVVNVVTGHGGHLPALHFRDALVRVQDKDVHVLAPAAALDGGRTGITGGGTHDHHVLLTLFQHVVQQAAEQLQGEILERQRGATEQLHHPFIGVQLHQRGHRLVGEHAVGVFQHCPEIIFGNSLFHERVHHVKRQIGVGQPAPAADFFQAEMRQGFGHVQPAIAGQAGQQNVFKTQTGGLAPCTDVSHVRTC